MEKENRLREIDIYAILKKIKGRKKLFALTLSTVFILSSLLIVSVPRYYACSVKLAPESTSNSLSGLSGISSMLGLNVSNLTSQDAIIPEFYPDVMESVDYTTDMFKVKITTSEGVKTNYYNYLRTMQKAAWWTIAFNHVKQLFSHEEKSTENQPINPFKLNKKQDAIRKMACKNIQGKVDKKTDVITITVTDQDPLVSAILADSAKSRLQAFIIKYRTSKAQNDLVQAQRLMRETKEKYQKAQRLYASYADANEDVVLQSFKSKQDELENEMQLQYNNYQTACQQVQISRAKLLEQTPAFTTLQSAYVPLKPAGPKRMIFVLFCLCLTFIGTTVYVCCKTEA